MFLFQKNSSLQEELAKKDAELQSARNELERLRTENSQLDAKCKQLENENESLFASKYENEETIKLLEGYYQYLEKIYCDIGLQEPTFRYAKKCFDSPLGLEFFNPVLYRTNSRYKNVIDLKANDLLKVYHGHTNGLQTLVPYSERYANMGAAYAELMRTYKINTNDSNASVASSRKNLEKISLEF